MNSEKQKVLEMLSGGQISAEEAARLLECLDAPEDMDEKSRRIGGEHLRGKKLRVRVDGYMERDKKMDVNVSVPLVLARHVDDIIANCVPEAVNRELAAEGINLRGIKISQIVDSLESLEEDIVNADIEQNDMNLKVRVYVE